MRRQSQTVDEHEFEVADRVRAYEVADVPDVSGLAQADEELVQRAATLLRVMPASQRRETIEELVAPHDPGRGRRAVDALIEAALATEDDSGRLRVLSAHR